MRKETWFKALALVLLFGINMTACSGGDRWKEEALYHDGKKIMVERFQTYGGMGEIGQSAPVKEHTLTFSLPIPQKKSVGQASMAKNLAAPILMHWLCILRMAYLM